MNLSELKLAFYDYVDDPKQDQFPEQQAERFINTAWRTIARKLDGVDEGYFIKCQTFSVSTTTNVDHVFNLPSDFKRVKLVERLNGNDSPTPVAWVDFKDRHERPNWPPNRLNNASHPLCFIKGKQFGVVSPAENYDLRMWYHYAVAALSVGSDSPSELPEDMHDAISLMAAKIAQSGVEGKPFVLQDLLDDALRDIPRFGHSRNRQQPRSVHYVETD